MNNLIAVHGGHNATVSLYKDGVYHNVELERLFKRRYFSLIEASYSEFADAMSRVLDVAKNHWGIENNFDSCQHMAQVEPHHLTALRATVVANEYVYCQHHYSHATSALYQSPFDRALIISYDGGGNDGWFNLYNAEKGKDLQLIHQFSMNLGTVYGLFGYPIKEIKSGNKAVLTSFLSLAGKIMGLAAYGTPKPEWMGQFQSFYMNCKRGDPAAIENFGHSLGEDFSLDSLCEQKAYDLAATSQRAFEELVLGQICPFINSCRLPVIMVGGCALNVLLNERIRKIANNQIFVPPNPDDGGLSFGMLANLTRPKDAVVLTYSGLPILDMENLPAAVQKYGATNYTLESIAALLKEGKIIGVMRDDSEHGPRALGNRSIICDPSFPAMKDILNAGIKFREWFRPFAPVVCEEDSAKYFDLDLPSQYMSYASKVNAEWLNKLPAITHVDGTARVQTVKQTENEWLYNLLQQWKSISPHGVLLNTSFNIKGKPILTTVEAALEVLDTTKIDYVIIDNWLFKKG